MLHNELVERRKRNKGEDELKQRLEESVATAENDQAPARNSGADLADDAEVKRLTTPHSKRSCGVNAYEAAVADLMVARRSSIRSRSTSQYLSAESRSLSGGSHPTDPLAASMLRA